ncbi:MAG: phenylalanine--tRNA ligase beta subunit-related protein, partial [Patescibacteria group bacterium]
MKISRNWLQTYFKDPLPSSDEIRELFIFHSYEVEGIDIIGDDSVFDLSILPNRAHDSLSHIGVAKELASLLPREMILSSLGDAKRLNEDTEAFVSFKVEDSGIASRAMKWYVQDVKVGDSPKWLVDYLVSVGQRSINNIVDATNYIMLETGQPVHAFNYDAIAGANIKNITIRFAHDGEKVTLLDGKEIALDGAIPVIADDNGPLDIAGIKGGMKSGINQNTKRILLSACSFDSKIIRRASKKLGMRTDASVRFGHDLSPWLAGLAIERLAQLISSISGGVIAKFPIDIYPLKDRAYKIGTSLTEVNSLLGSDLTTDEIGNTFRRQRFDFEIVEPRLRVLETARAAIGKPYKLGASVTNDAPSLFDCSSLVAYAYKEAGISVPRISVDQFV